MYQNNDRICVYIYYTKKNKQSPHTVTLSWSNCSHWEQQISLCGHPIFTSEIFFHQRKQLQLTDIWWKLWSLLIQFLTLFKSNHNDDNNPFLLIQHRCHSYLTHKINHRHSPAHDSNEDARPELLYHQTVKRAKGVTSPSVYNITKGPTVNSISPHILRLLYFFPKTERNAT